MLTAGAAVADTVERVVWAQVTQVEPLVESADVTPSADCLQPPPDRSQGLVALLRWDLRAECVAKRDTRTTGYRVEYRWDGRTYSRLMRERPGSEVRLLLKIH